MSKYKELLKHRAGQMQQINRELARRWNQAEQLPSVTERDAEKKLSLEQAQRAAKEVRDGFASDRQEGLRAAARYAFGAGEGLPEGEAATDRLFAELDKAAELKSPDAIRKAFDNADRLGDKTRMRAIAGRALEGGVGDVLQKYSQTDEGFIERAKVYADFSREANAKGNVVRDGLRLGTVHKPFPIETRQVEAGTDARGATIFRTETLYSEHAPVDSGQGDQASHEAMAHVAEQVKGRELHASSAGHALV